MLTSPSWGDGDVDFDVEEGVSWTISKWQMAHGSPATLQTPDATEEESR